MSTQTAMSKSAVAQSGTLDALDFETFAIKAAHELKMRALNTPWKEGYDYSHLQCKLADEVGVVFLLDETSGQYRLTLSRRHRPLTKSHLSILQRAFDVPASHIRQPVDENDQSAEGERYIVRYRWLKVRQDERVDASTLPFGAKVTLAERDTRCTECSRDIVKGRALIRPPKLAVNLHPQCFGAWSTRRKMQEDAQASAQAQVDEISSHAGDGESKT